MIICYTSKYVGFMVKENILVEGKMVESSPNSTQEAFSKFLNKAKKKLNKKEEKQVEVVQVEPEKESRACYQFEKSKRSEEKNRLKEKVKQLLKSNPETPYPIEQLIDHEVYDNLSEEAKSKYILQLSSDYNEVKSDI